MLVLRKIMRLSSTWRLVVIAAVLGMPAASPCAAAWLTPKAYNQTVVIDPGHGGHDLGARGPSGLLEKDVTLAMARVLQSELARDYRVYLTRKADYGLPVDDRTALANHYRADLFISLHTGGAFSPEPAGISVFYCRRAPEAGFSPAMEPPAAEPRAESWGQIYLRHRRASRRFARLASEKLARRLQAPVSVQGLPLRVLVGADMPAVLVEIGYLTHPLDEKQLQDASHLAEIAKALHAAIDAFFHHP